MVKKYKTLLSLDQSTVKTGFSIFDIETEKLIIYGLIDLTDIDTKEFNEPLDEKIVNNKEIIKRLISKYNIDLVALEDIQLQGRKGVKNFKNLSYLQGSLKNMLYENNIDYSIILPSVWRSILHLNGGVQKREFKKEKAIKYIENTFKIKATEDECDSLCIGLAILKKIKNNKLEIHSDIYGEKTKDEFIEMDLNDLKNFDKEYINTYLNKLNKNKLIDMCNEQKFNYKKSWKKDKIINIILSELKKERLNNGY